MSRLNIEILPPKNEQVNQIFAEMERKYSSRALTAETIDEMEREAARLIRRLITTKVTFVI